MNKVIVETADVENGFASGITMLMQVVSKTMGPYGSTIALQGNGLAPHITKDGVSVSESVKFSDTIENMGVQVVREAARKTDKSVGDGTTTTIVLTASMLSIGLASKCENSIYAITEGFNKAREDTISLLKEASKPVATKEDFHEVAMVASNGDNEIAKNVSEAFVTCGEHGIVTAKASNSEVTRMTSTTGLSFNKGFTSPLSITNELTKSFVAEDCYVIIIGDEVKNLINYTDLLREMESGQTLLVIVNDITDVLANELLDIRDDIKVCVVRAPEFGDRRREVLKDISIYIGCEIGESAIDDKCKYAEKYIHKVNKVTITESLTMIENTGTYERVYARIEMLEKQLEEINEDYNISKMKERIARLNGSFVNINVGGNTETEMIEKYDRYIDAIGAVSTAIKGGIIAGGGTSLAEIGRKLKTSVEYKEMLGYDIIVNAIDSPYFIILVNSGLIDATIKDKATKGIYVEPGSAREINHLAEGIIDPTNVTIEAFTNACSAVWTLMNVSNAVIEK